MLAVDWPLAALSDVRHRAPIHLEPVILSVSEESVAAQDDAVLDEA